MYLSRCPLFRTRGPVFRVSRAPRSSTRPVRRPDATCRAASIGWWHIPGRVRRRREHRAKEETRTMFTGIVEELGEIVAAEPLADAARLSIRGPVVTSDARHGD